MPDSIQVLTSARPGRGRIHLTLVLSIVFAAQLMTAAVLVPPWQNPDEPVHFAVIRTLTRNAWLDIAHRRNVDVQAEVLQSMAGHDWWRAYQEPVPPLLRSFADVPTHLGDAATAPPLYYVAMAAYLRALRAFDIERQYYLVRAASVMLTLLAFFCILRGAEEWFDERIAFYTGTLVALVPQFALIGISVSPDPLLFAVAAFAWWQTGRIAVGRALVVPLASMMVAVGVAVLSKQLAVPLLLQVPLLIAVIALRTRRGRVVVAASAAAAILLRLVGVLRAATFLAEPQLEALHRYKELFGWGRFESTPAYFADFSWRLFESAYIAAGWQRFYADRWIVAVALVVFVVLVGAGTWVGLRRAELRVRIATLAAVAFAVVQLAAIYGTNYFLPRWGAQGRFLFPAIGPFAALCSLALVRWPTRAMTAHRVRTGIVALLGVLSLMTWLTVLLPVYARWI